MILKNDFLLTQLTVCIQNAETSETLGTGIIYYNKSLEEKAYVLTAAHCLYNDLDKFLKPYENVNLLFYSKSKKKYEAVFHIIDYNFVSAEKDADVAILVLNKNAIESITGLLTEVKSVIERQTISNFILKGFPNAALGKELISTEPVWVQDLPTVSKFQLRLQQDFTNAESAKSQVEGFSGSGVFLEDNNEVYLFGVFTRFLEAGKIIYCQYLSTYNDVLKFNFFPTIKFTFLGAFGLTPEFFKDQADKTIKNLGPRFNEELNLKVPIALRFNDLAKDRFFKHRLSKVIDKYLIAYNYPTSSDILKEIEQHYNEIQLFIRKWFNEIKWSADHKIDTSQLVLQIEEFNKMASAKRSELYVKRSEINKTNNGQNKSYSYRELFQDEISRLAQMQENNRNLIYDLQYINFNLANNPSLLIKGDAGSGKSHMLGDILKSRNNAGLPAILLLGQLFSKQQGVWTNILTLLGLKCSKDEFLQTLNHIGQQVGSRVLLMVDALNEGAGKDLWQPDMAGFIHEVKKYPFIGVAFSVRSTYWDTIVPEQVRNDRNIIKITHEGFRGNEYKALNLFCIHYDLRQPNFPILAPEYTNPLFLQLICQGIRSSAERVFPQGFQGLSKIFAYYTSAISSRLINKRPDYKLYPKIAQNALEAVAVACYEQESTRLLPLEQAILLFDNSFPKFPYLLEDLIEESVLIRYLTSVYGDEENKEYVYFSYERFGDYFFAQNLLETHSADIKKAFQRDEPLGQLIGESYWRNTGILEAIAVLLPEKFSVEITEVYDWIFSGTKAQKHDIRDSINQWLINSLKWRRINSIDNVKLTKWIRESGHFRVGDSNWYSFLIEMTAVKDHPFNSDRLFDNLSRPTMAERDSFWQNYIQGYHGYDDDDMAFPLTRLIDWSWQEGISKLADNETARLAGQTLSWILCTTNRGLRDQTTKAMVNLLQDQPKALVEILEKFKDIDDFYIVERLYSVAYGCALRSKNNMGLLLISQAVYDNIFKSGNPPEHLLLRDYSRNTVEYAISKGITLNANLELVKPPYRSKLPIFPTEAKVKKKYKVEHEHKNYGTNNSSASNEILHSVLSWDFSRYIIDPALSHLSPIRFTLKYDQKEFMKDLPRDRRNDINLLKQFNEIQYKYERNEPGMVDNMGEIRYNEVKKVVDSVFKKIKPRLKNLLNTKQMNYIYNELMPQWNVELAIQYRQPNRVDGRPIKSWIVNRVFELGYDSKIHGQYDSSRNDYDHRTDGRVERIGKKYQWIAFHQIMAILTDNYKIRERYSDNKKGDYYKGAWEFMVRDIDPSFITRQKIKKYEEDEELEIIPEEHHWWSMEKYEYWYRIPMDWATTTADLPSQLKTIEKISDNGEKWVHLNVNYKWGEPKPFGKDRYNEARKEIWYMFQAYFVPRTKSTQTIKWLKQQDFFGRWLPENHSVTDLLARENYWSPISKQKQKETSTWYSLGDSKHKIMLATETAVGELSEDRSGAHFHYEMPCKKVFTGLNLRYSDRDGDFEISTGECVFTNISPNGCLMRKDVLIQYLDSENLDIIWLLLGEKNSFNKDDHQQDFRKSISGVYYLENGEITGSMTMNNW